MPLDPFGDYETRGYLQNRSAHKDPAAIARQEQWSYRLGIEEARAELAQGPLDYAAVLETHRILFCAAYPTWAGQDRAATAPDLRIYRPGMRFDFALPGSEREIVEHALDSEEAHSPGQLFTLLAYAHPFLDGNGRTITTVMDEAMRRQGKHIEWERMDTGAYLAALTRSLNTSNATPMNAFLRPFVKAGALSAEENSKRLEDKTLEPRVGTEPPLTMESLITSLVSRKSDP